MPVVMVFGVFLRSQGKRWRCGGSFTFFLVCLVNNGLYGHVGICFNLNVELWVSLKP